MNNFVSNLPFHTELALFDTRNEHFYVSRFFCSSHVPKLTVNHNRNAYSSYKIHIFFHLIKKEVPKLKHDFNISHCWPLAMTFQHANHRAIMPFLILSIGKRLMAWNLQFADFFAFQHRKTCDWNIFMVEISE